MTARGLRKAAPAWGPSNPVRMHDESVGWWYVQKVMTMLLENNPICNDVKLRREGKRLSRERLTLLMVELLARDPRPAIEYTTSCRLRRAEVVGDGTKKSPFRAEWREDYFKQ